MTTRGVKFWWLVVVLTVWLLVGIPAQGKQEQFLVAIGPNNELLGSEGSGYGQAQWYLYPADAWWSQWFYSGPHDAERKLAGDVSLTVQLLESGQPCVIQLAYSWATPAWSQLGRPRPPLPGDINNGADELKFIQRRVLYTKRIAGGSEPITVKEHFEIPYYNPQWVSIDVRGSNFVVLDGSLDHRSTVRGAGEVSLASDPMATAGTGACCLGKTTCTDNVDSQTCSAEGGTYMGDGTKCRTTDCSQPPGAQTEACCISGVGCRDVPLGYCTSRPYDGTPLGAGTKCHSLSDTECLWACCFANGSCENSRETQCYSKGGIGFRGSLILGRPS